MVRVVMLREIQRSGDAFRGNPRAEWILEFAEDVRMDMLLALMALGDMAAPRGGNIHTLVEWLNGHLDRLEALWTDHQLWLEHQNVLARARYHLRPVTAWAPTAQLIVTNDDASSVSTQEDEEAGDPLLHLRRTLNRSLPTGQEIPPFCICGSCGPNNVQGDCFTH